MADESSGEEMKEGILGLNLKLGLGKTTKKKSPKPQMLGYGALPQLPELAMQQKRAAEAGPVDETATDKAKNRVARSYSGGSKGIF